LLQHSRFLAQLLPLQPKPLLVLVEGREIVGFRRSHFRSGSGTKDYGSFQLLAGMDQPNLSKEYLA
jgi:hypothetical protein